MQRVTASQFSAVVLVGGTLMLSLADYFFHWRLSRFGLTAECDMALLSTIGREALRWLESCFGPSADGDTAIVSTIAREVQHWCHSCFGFTAESDAAIVCEALLCRLAYPFIHAHPLHAAVNGWVLLQLAFRTPLTLRRLLLAFVVAWNCPAVVAAWPTADPSSVVGLSGVLYALFGMWMPRVANRLRYNAIVALWLAAGLCTTSVAVGLHLYCYLLGILLSLLLSHPHSHR